MQRIRFQPQRHHGGHIVAHRLPELRFGLGHGAPESLQPQQAGFGKHHAPGALVVRVGFAQNQAPGFALIDQIAQAKGVTVKLEKVEELRDIMGYGVMSTPSVVINGKVVHVGGVPSRDKIEQWLTAQA